VETETWPYDASQDDPLAALRIPVVASPYPDWRYEVALVVSGDGLWGPALRPDDAETAQIAAYIGYRMEYYNEGWKAKMRRRPFDIDGTTNTVVLRKRGEGDWCYRRCSWVTGVFWYPPQAGQECGETLGLEQLLDRIHFYGDDKPSPKWLAWKAAHPEAFPEAGE